MSDQSIIPTDNDGELEVISNSDVIPVPEVSQDETVKRIIAEAMRRGGIRKFLPEADPRKEVTYAEWLSTMVWDGITEGVVVFADGTKMPIGDDAKTWISLVKFLAGHLDGAVNPNAQFNGVNIFKIYKGIDPDRL
jgi:hypothetical protein